MAPSIQIKTLGEFELLNSLQERLRQLGPPDHQAIAQAMKEMYEQPLDFWMGFLDKDLHYHLGHFRTPYATLNDGMRTAVDDLIELNGGITTGMRILDVGCGWGGPASILINEYDAIVVGLTTSFSQCEYVQRKLGSRAVVHRMNVETEKLREADTFDVVWMFESLEHLIKPETFFRHARTKTKHNGKLLITTSCTAERAPQNLYSTSLGMQPLATINQLVASLACNGWIVEAIEDCTSLTVGSWEKWRSGLVRMQQGVHSDLARQLIEEYTIAEALFTGGLVASFQIVARKAD